MEINNESHQPDYGEHAVRQWLTDRKGRSFTFYRGKEDFLYLAGLLDRHPSKSTWKQQNPSAFKIQTSKTANKAIQLHVSFRPAHEKPKYRIVSWLACANMKLKKSQRPDSVENQLNSAMRHAIRVQISNYRKQNLDWRCVLCTEAGKPSPDKTEVDHYPERFVSLRDDFILIQTKRGNPPPTEFKWHPKRGNNMFLKKDDKWKQAWQRYHRKHATYRFLCPTCNKKSTAK